MDMIQEIEKLTTTTGDFFSLGAKPILKGMAGFEGKKIKLIGLHEARGPGDALYYIVQFEDDSLVRIYNPKQAWFGKPKPKPQLVKVETPELITA